MFHLSVIVENFGDKQKKMTRIFAISAAAWILGSLCVWMPTPGSALKCYVCNSMINENCDAVKDDQYLVDCATVDTNEEKNHTNCRTETFSAISVEFQMHTQRTIRSCGYETHPRLSCFHSSNKDLKGTTCECAEDGCNGSTMLQFASKVLLIVVLCGFLASLLA